MIRHGQYRSHRAICNRYISHKNDTGSIYKHFFNSFLMDDSFSDSDFNQSYIIDTDQFADDRLLSKLILLLPTLQEVPRESFSHFDLRSNSDGKARIISDHMYALHIAYLLWKRNRKPNEAIPLTIQKTSEVIKPKIKDNRKLLRSFVQKRLTEYSRKVWYSDNLLRYCILAGYPRFAAVFKFTGCLIMSK